MDLLHWNDDKVGFAAQLKTYHLAYTRLVARYPMYTEVRGVSLLVFVGKVLEELLDERGVFLGVLCGAGLENLGAFAGREVEKCAEACA